MLTFPPSSSIQSLADKDYDRERPPSCEIDLLGAALRHLWTIEPWLFGPASPLELA